MAMFTESISDVLLLLPLFCWSSSHSAIRHWLRQHTAPLLDPSDFAYLGSFKAPTGTFGTDTFEYSGGFVSETSTTTRPRHDVVHEGLSGGRLRPVDSERMCQLKVPGTSLLNVPIRLG